MQKNFFKNWTFLFKLRLFLGLIFFIFVGGFLYLKIVPFGVITYSRDYTSFWRSGKGFIYGFTPAERVDLVTGEGARLVGDPIYFSLFAPRTFDQAKVTFVYRNNLSTSTPLIEAGVLVDNIVWRYDLKPVENITLDYLASQWFKIEENGYLFLQKNKYYLNLEDFNKDLASGHLQACDTDLKNCLAVYNYTPAYNYLLPDYHPSAPLVLDEPLRGAHQFYVYLDKEDLKLEFSLIDLNQDLKAAPIEIILSSQGQVVASRFLPDDNLRPGSGDNEEKNIILEQKNLPTGVYKVEVKITDDMVIKKIVSSLSRLAFINKLWPVSSKGNLKIYTDADYLQVKALNPASLQTLKFAEREFKLDEAYRQFDFKIEKGAAIKEIQLKKDDVILENNGVFAWAPESLFNPTLTRVDRFFSASAPLQYIIADYQAPRSSGTLKTASVELNLKNAYRENGKYSFMLSIPGLKTDDELKDNLEIYKIKIELKGRTLWQKIWQ